MHVCVFGSVCVCWGEYVKGCVGACRSACVSIFKKSVCACYSVATALGFAMCPESFDTSR